MTKETTKTTGKVIPALVKEYHAIIAGNEGAIRGFIRKAHKTTARDLEATLKEAAKAGAISAIRPAYANYFGLANTALSIPGADKVAVADFMKVVAVAQRTLRKDGALELVARVNSWADFESKTRDAESIKKSKSPRAGKGRSKNGKVKTSFKDADSLISSMLNAWAEMEDVTITDLDSAEKLAGALKVAIQSSKALKAQSKANHPTAKANA